jgi:hypothetical protein
MKVGDFVVERLHAWGVARGCLVSFLPLNSARGYGLGWEYVPAIEGLWSGLRRRLSWNSNLAGGRS